MSMIAFMVKAGSRPLIHKVSQLSALPQSKREQHAIAEQKKLMAIALISIFTQIGVPLVSSKTTKFMEFLTQKLEPRDWDAKLVEQAYEDTTNMINWLEEDDLEMLDAAPGETRLQKIKYVLRFYTCLSKLVEAHEGPEPEVDDEGGLL